jgi:transposase
MDARQQKGLEIAATINLQKKADGSWSVPSQSLNGKYAVTMTDDGPRCSCPDYELRQKICKHGWAVQYALFRETRTETKPDGTVTTTTTEETRVRVTYGQPNWSAYHKAQCNEKDYFVRLLHGLVADVPTAEQKGAGRRVLPMADMIFSAAYKVYSGFSARRFMSDMRDAADKGLVSQAPCYNSIFNYMALENMTPILHDLIEASAKPLAALETQFAVDSTGIGTECFYRHFSAKWGKDKERREFVKLHVLIGTRTNVVASCKITTRENDHGDVTEFKPLVEQGSKSFDMKEISGDLAYSSYANLEVTESIGAKPFIPFKSSSKPVSKSHKPKSSTWTRLYHYFELNREEFLEHYHRRSNVESSFSMIKRCISDTLRSKTTTAQVNEALLVVLCHNVRCLIHEAFELGIAPTLEKYICPTIPTAPQGILEVAQQSPTV